MPGGLLNCTRNPYILFTKTGSHTPVSTQVIDDARRGLDKLAAKALQVRAERAKPRVPAGKIPQR